MESFVELLVRAVAAYGGKKKLADAVGISPSRLSRALGGDFPFNVENCLRLAHLTGESPSQVLRAANKGDVVDLIEQLYGKESPFTAEEGEIVAFLRSLSKEGRAGLMRFARASVESATDNQKIAQPPKRRRTA